MRLGNLVGPYKLWACGGALTLLVGSWASATGLIALRPKPVCPPCNHPTFGYYATRWSYWPGSEEAHTQPPPPQPANTRPTSPPTQEPTENEPPKVDEPKKPTAPLTEPKPTEPATPSTPTPPGSEEKKPSQTNSNPVYPAPLTQGVLNLQADVPTVLVPTTAETRVEVSSAEPALLNLSQPDE